MSSPGYDQNGGNYIEYSGNYYGVPVSFTLMHLSNNPNLPKGTQINPGQVIARAGRSGKVTGPHVHLQVKLDGKEINPVEFLNLTKNYKGDYRNKAQADYNNFIQQTWPQNQMGGYMSRHVIPPNDNAPVFIHKTTGEELPFSSFRDVARQMMDAGYSWNDVMNYFYSLGYRRN